MRVLAAGTRREVSLLQQGDAQIEAGAAVAQGEVSCNAGAVDAAAQDQDVDGAFPQTGEVGFARIHLAFTTRKSVTSAENTLTNCPTRFSIGVSNRSRIS